MKNLPEVFWCYVV
ncbi:hypothetical protein LL065_07315 [Clostridium estertheticum]|nr:hypothetical protein LL065_07315 [Clostridium estertheticum]